MKVWRADSILRWKGSLRLDRTVIKNETPADFWYKLRLISVDLEKKGSSFVTFRENVRVLELKSTSGQASALFFVNLEIIGFCRDGVG